ncbi:hypothetical protein A2716_02120 [candidate division WWE3 bacterium RIFCSPHIGHO2_01_FULL_40_23]|uniref:YtkA-like domain-containing protein n=1 Tax=candidate division WWE3 bacterium RIFCSPLOWO2_01_FULL_41_18 TaxID=1802625 RepID=A0A1F4VF46_UNCKA|nr:MAG: hypothetical protein A2716_02120 [candidate division WWE3 bacterium RIFCSPHIGHO2_01_FULL_40_23]OGC55784.1 MAG: hypothetical protein A3A78_01970 [candidate division WWE3 bacterium RIFCSPLOWO2_01_FULL_41_18]
MLKPAFFRKFACFLITLTIILSLNKFYAYAHVDVAGEEPEDIKVTIVEPDLFPAKTPLTIWLEVKDKETNKTEESLDILVNVKDSKGNDILNTRAEPKKIEGEEINYIFEITFPSSGEYKILYEFLHDDEKESFTFPIIVSEPLNQPGFTLSPTLKTGVIIVGALLLAAAVFFLFTKRFKELMILFAVSAVAGIVGYSLIVTISSGALKSGVVTCLEDGRCFWTAHIHAYLAIEACGEKKLLPSEVGPLAKVHTHEEQNVFHWHDRLPYDTQKKEILDTKPLTLGSSFDDIGIPFDKGNAFDLKDGDKCPNKEVGTWRMFVNGKQNDEFRDYIWQDRDVILLIFGNKSPSEVEENLKINPIKFPALGRG